MDNYKCIRSSSQRDCRSGLDKGCSPWLLALLLTFSAIFVPNGDFVLAQEEAPAPQGAYQIGVGDVLSVSVWKNPELSSQVPVRPDGMIALTLVGEVEVAGSTPSQVRQVLNQRYSKFVTAPTISVVVNEINSMKMFTVGEVNNSGAYDIVQPTRLMQALAMAGGLTEYANKDNILVLRQEGDAEKRLMVSIKGITNGKKPADNIVLQPGDTVVVP